MRPVDQIADELEGLVETTVGRLRDVDDGAASRRPAPGKWSSKEILGHLVDSAANNHQRFVRAQYVAPLVFPRYEQDEWVSLQRYQESDWPGLVALWRVYNRHLAHVMRNIPADTLPVECRIGANEPATLHFLLEDYIDHMKHHLGQIEERLGGGG